MRSFAVTLLFHLSSYKWSNLCTLSQAGGVPSLFSHMWYTDKERNQRFIESFPSPEKGDTAAACEEMCPGSKYSMDTSFHRGQSPDRPVYAGTDPCLTWRHLYSFRNIAIGLALLLNPQKAEHPMNYSLSFHICS